MKKIVRGNDFTLRIPVKKIVNGEQVSLLTVINNNKTINIMEVKVKRIARRDTYTIGKMYVDGAYVCDTLEDKDRGLTSNMSVAQICGVKIKGETAIPTGRYLVDMKTVSPRFGGRAQYQFCKGRLPRLCNTPGYQGVLIHIGNTAKDTEGCILVGENKERGKVLNSTATFRKVYAKLKAADERGEQIWITIE